MPIPALLDLSEDVAAGIPIGLARAWAAGDRSEERARELLAPYRVTGTLVRSDTPGLAEITEQVPLTEALTLVSRPKEVLHALGKLAGGKAVGRWVADNAVMFFEQDVSADRILCAMLEVHRRHGAGMARVGLAIGCGEFYSLKGGLYGGDADAICLTGEEHTAPGETVVSTDFAKRLRSASAFGLSTREDLPGWLRVDGGPGWPQAPLDDRDYPAPYDDGLRQRLRELQEGRDAEEVLAEIEVSYLQERTVLIIEGERAVRDRSAAGLLERLHGYVAIHRLVRFLVADGGVPYKVAGRFGIIAYPTAKEALAASRSVVPALGRRGVKVRMGLARGEVLVFSMEHGQSEFAGEAIALAARLAEASPENGLVVERALAEDLGVDGEATVVHASGVSLDAVRA
ncbi:MAG: hypothetical protein EP330_03975 [Deltaproteobacteria bacterium]|nr:MAG: hypothetical protein EP330_03975 [Deltaproteobacteria bacterium]